MGLVAAEQRVRAALRGRRRLDLTPGPARGGGLPAYRGPGERPPWVRHRPWPATASGAPAGSPCRGRGTAGAARRCAHFWGWVDGLGHRAARTRYRSGGCGTTKAPVRVLVLAELPRRTADPRTPHPQVDVQPPGDTVGVRSSAGGPGAPRGGGRPAWTTWVATVPREVPAGVRGTCRGTSSGPTCSSRWCPSEGVRDHRARGRVRGPGHPVALLTPSRSRDTLMVGVIRQRAAGPRRSWGGG